MRYTTIEEQVGRLIVKHGSLRKAAEAVGITAPYLHRLGTGEKIAPSEQTLFKLGLRAEVRYYRPTATIPKGTFK